MKSARNARIFCARLKGGLCDREAFFFRIAIFGWENLLCLMELGAEADNNVVL
jgi:hypothetical protein